MFMSLYTCMESADKISRLSLLATSTAVALLPTPVGPKIPSIFKTLHQPFEHLFQLRLSIHNGYGTSMRTLHRLVINDLLHKIFNFTVRHCVARLYSLTAATFSKFFLDELLAFYLFPNLTYKEAYKYAHVIIGEHGSDSLNSESVGAEWFYFKSRFT